MADSEVRVVDLGDKQELDDGPVVPKGEAPPADPPLVRIDERPPDPDSELKVVEEPPPAVSTADPAAAVLPPEPDAVDTRNVEPPAEEAPVVEEPVVLDDKAEPVVVDDKAEPVVVDEDETPPAAIADGTSNTILLPEADAEAQPATPDEHAPAAPRGVAEIVDGSSNTILFPEALFDEAPPFATGATEPTADAASTATDAGVEPAPIDDEPLVPEPTAAVVEAPPVEDDPLEILGEEDEPDFLEQVAEAVGDLWDDSTDAVT